MIRFVISYNKGGAGMDLFQLKCFVSVVEQKSFTKAAFEAAISQSALSKNISRLEDELNVLLFDRSRRSAVLTPTGREFEPHARKMLEDYEHMLAAVRRFSASGYLHVGSIEHMGRVGLTAPISSFLSRCPDGAVRIDIERGDTQTLMNQLTAGKLDMAFIAHIISPGGLRSNIDGYQLEQYRLYTLVRDEYHVIVSSQHRFARRQSLSWSDLAPERLLLLDKSYSSNSMIREAFLRRGQQPNIAFECDQVDTLLGMAEENFGAALLSRRISAARYAVTAVKMDEPITRNTVLVIPREVESRQRLAGEFARHVVRYFEENPDT